MKLGMPVTWKAPGASRTSSQLHAANTKFGFSLALAALSNVGLIRMHGGQEGLQKSTIKPGLSLINFYRCERPAILQTSPTLASSWTGGA